VKSGGGSFGHVSVQVGADWWTHLSTYEDYSPILDLEAGSTSLSVCIAGGQFDESAVQFARELAQQAARFAAEVERLHGLRGGDEAREDGAGAGEAA
jgi:hypothetical protein